MPVGRFIRLAMLLLAGAVVAFAVSVSAVAATRPGCSACHAKRTPALVRASAGRPHQRVACTACHVPTDPGGRLSFASRQVLGMTLRILPKDGSLAAVPDERCIKCHGAALKGTVEAKGLRFNHRTCAKGRSCTDCHSATAHGTTGWVRTAQMSDCLSCHSTKRVSEDCDLCHTSRGKQERLEVGGWRTTHGPTWKTTHGMGNLGTCSACHEASYCSRCHDISLPHAGDYIASHGVEAIAKPATCTSCHQTKACDSCHGTRMPHAPSFTKAHPKEVKRVGEKTCLSCHQKADCEECHLRHVHPVTDEEIRRLGKP